jgi:hypothetical protein
MLTIEEIPKMAGRVVKTCKGLYGFIRTDAGTQFYFHAVDCIPEQQVYPIDTVVRFTVVPDTGGRNPRAIHVEAL